MSDALLGAGRLGSKLKAGAVVLLLAGSGLGLLAASPDLARWVPGQHEPLTVVRVAGDLDADGLPDAFENVIGSDPAKSGTLDAAVPDGWLYHWYGTAVDWEQEALLDAAALAPPFAELPEALQEDGLPLPTVRDVHDRSAKAAEGRGVAGAWWLEVPGLDPTAWDNDADGVADAWLLAYGLDPLELDAADEAPGDSGMTLRAKYEAGLDPTQPDTDGDGLHDAEELRGAARVGDLSLQFTPSDPRRFSSRGDGISDGYLARVGLPTDNASVAALVPLPGGLSVGEGFDVTQAHCVVAAAGPCPWRQRLADGPLVDPTVSDSLGDGVPDAWEHHEPSGAVHPLEDSRKVVLDSSADWDSAPWSRGGEERGTVVDELNPLPLEPTVVTAVQAYTYRRPGNWSEDLMGPWWDGLPASIDRRPGSLPASIALRGWSLGIDTGLGGTPRPAVVNASADPRLADTDGDGFTDAQEYFGLKGHRTNPADPDTDRDGLPDAKEAAYGTKPLARDTPGGFLADGEREAYWLGQAAEAERMRAEDPIGFRARYAELVPPGAGSDGLPDVARLRPEGVVRGPQSNMLTADADGDGLKDGAELFPNDHLDADHQITRPATLPWAVDSDGDALPDWWEIAWSRPAHYCSTLDHTRPPHCSGMATVGWPLDPSKARSQGSGKPTDGQASLVADAIQAADGTETRFRTRLAYVYDLNPYTADTDKDGLRNMFELHWGVADGLSDHIHPGARAALASSPADYPWAEAALGRLSKVHEARAGTPLEAVILDPGSMAGGLGPASNLRGAFDLREKGVWVNAGGTCLQRTALPGAGDARGEEAPRAGLVGCWTWVDHPLGLDQQHGLDPWALDSDGDDLPDAWVVHYGLGDVGPETLLAVPPPSKCDGSAAGGVPMPSANKCLTYRVAYERGLDPTKADTDGGSMLDWDEVARGLNPLDPADDEGERDWDLDGLKNRAEAGVLDVASPDSDRDGLADGDDVCLDPEGDLPLAATTGRPDGRRTSADLAEVYLGLGILRDEGAANGCPDGHILFLGEGVLSQADGLVHGAGGGTDPGKADTAGNGVPDGWLVYWRERAPFGEAAQSFDPLAPIPPARRDADFDLVPLADEYKAGRPATWSEVRDGVWWGGTDPTRADTDGDRAWFKTSFDGDDLEDQDLDNDGIAADDPSPLADEDGSPVSWDGERHVTDHARVFALLATRSDGAVGDSDTDGIPDFLDRVQVKVALDPVTDDLVKGRPFAVDGRVTTDEAPVAGAADHGAGGSAPPGSPVAGATVHVWLAAGSRTSLVGIGFTGADGRFSITAATGPEVESEPAPAGGALVAGTLVLGGATATLASDSPQLVPGAATLFATVEASLPSLDTVRFGSGQEAAEAFKQVPASGYLPPGGGKPLRAVALAAGQPDPGKPAVRHAAEDVFPGRSDPLNVALYGQAQLSLDAVEPALVGSVVPVRGRLLDSFGAPLVGTPIHVELRRGTAVVPATVGPTGAGGVFTGSVATAGLAPGEARLVARIAGDLPPGLLPPDQDPESPFQVRTASGWTGVVVGRDDLDHGAEAEVDAATPFPVEARLVDHLGEPLAGRAAVVQLLAGSRVDQEISLVTDDEGLVRLSFQVRPTAADGRLVLRIAVAAADGFETHSAFGGFVAPRFSSVLDLDPLVVVPLGAGANLTGTLTRFDGRPISSGEATLHLASSQGGSLEWEGTGRDGGFRVPLPPADRGTVVWTVAFPGLGNLLPAREARATVVTTVASTTTIEPFAPLVDVPVAVRGEVRPAAGAPANGTVVLRWLDAAGNVTVHTDEQGRFAAVLPPRTRAGSATVVAGFLGEPEVRPSEAEATSTARMATRLEVAAVPVAEVGAGGPDALLAGTLLDSRGNPLPGRTVRVDARFADSLPIPLAGAWRLNQYGDGPVGSWVADGDAAVAWAAKALPLPFVVRGVDADGDGWADRDAPLFLAAGGRVANGDVRLTGPAGPGAVVNAVDPDLGKPLSRPLGLGYVDRDRDGRPGPGDVVVADLDGSNTTSRGDVRLVPSGSRDQGSRMASGERDVGVRLEPFPGVPVFVPSQARSTPRVWDAVLWRTAETPPAGPGGSVSLLTNATGAFAVGPGSGLDLSGAGPVRFEASYAGTSLEGASRAVADSKLVHHVVPEIRQAPAAVDRGTTFAVMGALVSSGRHASPVPVRALVDGAVVAETYAAIGQPWRLEVPVPEWYADAQGGSSFALQVEAALPEGFTGDAVAVTIGLHEPITVTMEVHVAGDGSRRVDVSLDGASAGAIPSDGVVVRVLRVDEGGRFLGAHTVRTDGAGRATLELLPTENGRLRATAIRDPSLYVAGSTARLESFDTSVSTDEPWPIWPLAAAAAVFGLGALATWVLLRRAARQSLGAAVAREHRLLVGDDVTPAEAVRRVHAHLLGMLRRSGYQPTGAETARDIADRAAARLVLPAGPLHRLTLLFEAAAYGGRALGRGAKAEALGAFTELAQALKVRVVHQGAPA